MIRCSTVRPKEPNMPAQPLAEFVFRERQATVSNDSFSRHAWKTMTRAMTTTDLWTLLAKSPLADAPSPPHVDAADEAVPGATVLTPPATLIDAIRLMETQVRAPSNRTPTDALARLDGDLLDDAACRACREMLCRTATDGSRCIDAPGNPAASRAP
jgi:hypothetical protein